MNEYNGFSEKERLKGDRIIKKAIENGDLPPLNQTRCCICGQDKGIRQYHCEDYSPEIYIRGCCSNMQALSFKIT